LLAVSEPARYSTEVSLRWRDIDIFGHVKQSVFHDLFEEGRVGLMAELYSRSGQTPHRGGFVMRHVELSYRHEVRRDHEYVTITARLVHVGSSSIRLAQEVILPDGTVAASGATVLAGWDPEIRGKRVMTDDERSRLVAQIAE
jgi:acyl-CoA thioester hydrolase